MAETARAASPRRPPIYGPEPWRTVADTQWCHFDRWFALVAVADFDGDLDALEREFVGQLRSPIHFSNDIEAKLSHLAELRERLERAGLAVGDMAEAEEPDRPTLSKARRKVLEQGLEDRAKTDAMRETPRVRLVRRARYGHWPAFPVNPDKYYEKLAGKRPPSFVSKGRSFTVTRNLRERLERHDSKCRTDADRLALYRAFFTVGVELAERSDDSYGVIGEMRLEAFEAYLDIDWVSAGLAAADRWQDLCELLVSDDFALTYKNETMPFLGASATDADFAETVLHGLEREYRDAYLDYRADEALQLIAWLQIAGRRYARYVEAASRLGTDHWIPIVALAESAIESGRRELAAEVFRAADRPGFHRDMLRQRCRGLTGVDLGETPHLRLVGEEGN